jgi:potassium efflux system protein
MSAARALIGALALVLALALGLGHGAGGWAAWAQEAATEDQGPPDYKAWERTAKRAEAQTQDRNTSDAALSTMRGYLVEWRATFQAAQGVNAARIATLRQQIDALGSAPAEGKTEAIEIAERRTELNDQLASLQAPVIAADEAYRRADGLIKEIDRQLRERQADQLMQIWPMPINPANWPVAIEALRDMAVKVWNEARFNWQSAAVRENVLSFLPVMVVTVLIGVLLIWRGRWSMEWLNEVLSRRASRRWYTFFSLFTSLGEFLLPAIGFFVLFVPIQSSRVLGPVGMELAEILAGAGITIFAAAWLGRRVFPKPSKGEALLDLSAERQAEGRFYSTALGVLSAFEDFRATAVRETGAGNDVNSVLSFPGLVLGGLILVRLGQILRTHQRNSALEEGGQSFRNRLIGLTGRAAIYIGFAGPVLAALGYVSAATALVYPAAQSLALMALIFVLIQLAEHLFALITNQEDRRGDALLPTLVGFALVLASLPVFALIWGARTSDISELWTRFLDGFAIGETQISPGAFLTFAIVFAIGYMLTRLVQGALASSVLPKTKLDQGGRNAIVSGLGYIGFFLSGLVAINAAGINLAGLAIVAGALSVGIGFGLQNIVSNFVSGIILLVERPVSEGDWIEVGGVQGVVKAISVRSTRIQTFDRTDVIVPNTDLIAGRVTNWTRYNLTGRLILPVSVAFGADTRKVERILREIAEAEPLAVMNPPPSVLLMGFTPDAMLYEIRLILRDVNFQLQVRSEINHAILKRFAEEGIELSLSVAAQAQTRPAAEEAEAG